MSIIPNVSEVIINCSKKLRKAESLGPNLQRLEKAGFEFKEFLKKEICTQLEHQCHAEVVLKHLGSYRGIPGDVLLYGHRKSSTGNADAWYQRSSLFLEEMPFRSLQKEFLEQGWYLIEETDPSISREFIFKVYMSAPKKHPYYNTHTLWHNNNFIYQKDKNDINSFFGPQGPSETLQKKALLSWELGLPSWDLDMLDFESKNVVTEQNGKSPDLTECISSKVESDLVSMYQ